MSATPDMMQFKLDARSALARVLSAGETGADVRVECVGAEREHRQGVPGSLVLRVYIQRLGIERLEQTLRARLAERWETSETTVDVVATW